MLWLLEDKGVGCYQVPKVVTRCIQAAFTKSILETDRQVVGYDTLREETIEQVKSKLTVSAAQKYRLFSPPAWNIFHQILDEIGTTFNQIVELKLERRYSQNIELFRIANEK